MGETISQHRERLGYEWTQDRVAQAAGISTRYYQKLEYGEQLPSIETLFKLSQAFGITPDELLMPCWKKWPKKRKRSR